MQRERNVVPVQGLGRRPPGDRSHRLGSLLLTRVTVRPGAALALGGAEASRADRVAVHLLPDGRVWRDGGEAVTCRAGDVLVVDAPGRWALAADTPAACRSVIVPRRALAATLPPRTEGGLVHRSAPLAALVYLVDSLLAIGGSGLTEAQQQRWAAALIEMMSAALSSGTPPAAAGREAGLLERAVAAIDAHAREPLTMASLCAMLGCSRSALYRATAPAGGVAELMTQRRLQAVRVALDDPADARPVLTIAHDHGFTDAAQFGRRFKRQFGVTPGAYRQTRGATAEAAACD